MKKIFTIIDRVKKHFGSKSEGEVAALLGISKTALANHKTRGTIPYDAIFTFCENNGVSLDWLFSGEGHFKKGASFESDGGNWDNGYVMIPVTRNLTSSIQRGSSKIPPNEMIAFKKDWIINELPAKPDDLQVFQIFDDTMEPTLKNGDLVLIDSKYSDERSVAPSDGIYFVSFDEHLMIKRLQILPGGVIQIVSDNQAYKPFLISSNQFPEKAQIIGRVVWAGKKMI